MTRAKKQKPQMRIAYNKKNDEYQLLIRTNEDEEWGYEIGCRCFRREHDDKDAEPMFIACTMLEQIKHNLRLGFELVY